MGGGFHMFSGFGNFGFFLHKYVEFPSLCAHACMNVFILPMMMWMVGHLASAEPREMVPSMCGILSLSGLLVAQVFRMHSLYMVFAGGVCVGALNVIYWDFAQLE